MKRSSEFQWQTYDADLCSYPRFDSWHPPKRVLKKAARTLRGQRLIERNWEVHSLGESEEEGLQKWLVRPAIRLHELLPRNEIESLLDQFRRPSRDPVLGHTVSMLLTFSAGLELHG